MREPPPFQPDEDLIVGLEESREAVRQDLSVLASTLQGSRLWASAVLLALSAFLGGLIGGLLGG